MSITLNGTTFRVDNLWEEFGIAGEADGRVKYEGHLATATRYGERSFDKSGWRTKLVCSWFGGPAQRCEIDAKSVVARWWRMVKRRSVTPWAPPSDLTLRLSEPTRGGNQSLSKEAPPEIDCQPPSIEERTRA